MNKKKMIFFGSSCIVFFFLLFIFVTFNDSINRLSGDITSTQPMLGNAVEYISSLAGNADPSSTEVIEGTSFAYDSSQNLRYVGSNPNNYIQFNDELWRIIGVIDIGGTKHLKIVRDGSIGKFAWNSAPDGWNSTPNGYGSNEWGSAVLMKLINPGYEDNTRVNPYVDGGKEPANNSLYWNRQAGKCLTTYNEGWLPCDFTQTGLKPDYRRLIAKTNWNIGKLPDHTVPGQAFGTDLTPNDIYQYEKSETWNGYVGLLSFTDFAFAISNENSERSICLSEGSVYMDDDECFNNLYLFDNDLSNGTYGGYNYWHNLLNTQDWNEERIAFGPIGNNSSYRLVHNYSADYVTKPVIFLKPDVNLRSGSGTHDDPYIIGMTYNAEFNDDGRITNVTVEEGNNVNAIDSQGKEGYTFKHWSLTKNGEAYDFSTVLTESITLYAVYEPNDLSVEFYNKNKEFIKKIDLKYDELIDVDKIPVISDSDFIGWRENGSKINFNFEDTVKRNYKLYAKEVSECNKIPNGVRTLRNKKDNNTVFEDEFGNLRFRGKTANNFITFNNELWRIVGTFKVMDKYGVFKERIKIVRENTLLNSGSLVYDSSDTDNSKIGVNEWSQSDIMKLLNPGYDNNKDMIRTTSSGDSVSNLVNNSLYWNKQSGYCMNGYNNSAMECDFSEEGLNDDAKQYIETVIWNTGAVNYNARTTYSVRDLYEEERDNKDGKYNMPPISYTPDSIPRKTKWLGKIGLLNGSDVEYTSNSIEEHTIEECLSSVSTNLYCKQANSWFIFNNAPSHFLMTPVYGSDPYYVLADSFGSLYSAATNYNGYYINPALYLKSNIELSGDGTSDSPYTIAFYDEPRCIEDVNVTFNDEDRVTTIVVDKGGKAESIDSQGKEGHTFSHWSLNKNGEAFDFDTNIDNDLTLYAVYEINKYNIEFYDSYDLLDTQRIEYNNMIDQSNIPIVEKDGFEFVGWREENSNENFDLSTNIKKSYKLYAYLEKINQDEEEKCDLSLESDKYEIDKKNNLVNGVPDNETIEEMKKHFTTAAQSLTLTTTDVVVSCDGRFKTYKINRVVILKTGVQKDKFAILLGLISLIISLLLIINKQKQEKRITLKK